MVASADRPARQPQGAWPVASRRVARDARASGEGGTGLRSGRAVVNGGLRSAGQGTLCGARRAPPPANFDASLYTLDASRCRLTLQSRLGVCDQGRGQARGRPTCPAGAHSRNPHGPLQRETWSGGTYLCRDMPSVSGERVGGRGPARTAAGTDTRCTGGRTPVCNRPLVYCTVGER